MLQFAMQEVGCVMSFSEAALRDPMFYRWHVFVDDIFQQYKSTLPAYTVEEVIVVVLSGEGCTGFF